jgi:hypothetical protein
VPLSSGAIIAKVAVLVIRKTAFDELLKMRKLRNQL